MFLSDLSIKRPIFATVMMLVLVTLGLFSYRRLAIDMYPDVEMPVLTVVTRFPGASPETIEREVTKRIEEVVNRIPGVRHIISTSRESVSNVVIVFQLEVRINEAAEDARAKINTIRRDLPREIEDPIIQKFDFTAMPVISLALRSDGLSPRELTTLAEKKIQRRFENLAGVGKVELVGTAKREISVTVDPARLDALGMGIDEVIAGLQSENVNTPLGRLHRGNTESTLRVSGKPDAVSGFRGMVIAARGGRPVTLGEISDVRDDTEEERTTALVNGTRAVAIDIIKQTGANTVGVVDRVKAETEKLRAELPPGVRLEIVRDGSIMIRDSVHDVQDTMIIGGILTILIVFCFLNSWRSTVITGLTLPISVISTFTVMNFMGMTLNVLTLMALSLAIGLLIDDAIVVRENIVRHLERGEDHFTAARNGTAEIGLAVMATTFTIVAVFVPVAYMKGIVGRFFFQFGITVSFAVLVSLFVSFTLDPMLSSRWHDPDIDRTGKRHPVARVLDRFNDWFESLSDRYRLAVSWALAHQKATLFFAFAAFLGGLFVFFSLPSAFFTEMDNAELQVSFRSAPDASIEETRGRLDRVLALVRTIPDARHTYATIGAGGAGTVRDAALYVKLTEKDERAKSQKDIQQDLRQGLQEIPGIIPSIMEAGRMDNQKPLLVNIRGDDIALLKKYAAALKEKMSRIGGIVDIEATMEHDVPEFRLRVNRDLALNAGVTTDTIVRSVSALVGGQAVSTYEDEDGDAVDLRVRLPLPLRQDPEQVGRLNLAVQKPDGASVLVPLRALVSPERSVSPDQINRQDLSREVVISANLSGLALGTAVKKVREAAADLKLAKGYRVVFSGEAEDMAESFGYMAEALILAMLLVYFVLAAQFESFISPLAIMLSLPLSLVGMAGMLFVTGDTINIMSLIGLIMLMGLVTKNAILLVDFTQVLRSRGMERNEAIVTAGRIRLRPIMMTTLAMIFGMLPLALSLGKGAEMRAPMARAVIGGMLTSTFLTLLVVPVMYARLDDFSAWLRRRFKKEVAS